jgi:hypothetical protein
VPSTCYLIGAIAFLAKIVIDIETRYRLLETIREYGEERLDEAGETDRWQARHADYYVDVLKQIRHHDRREEVFWAVRLSAEQDNLLAAWSWAIDTLRWPLLLDGEAVLELPGAAAHPGYPLALAVSARFASNRADVTVTEELCRAAAEANERRDPHDWRVEEVICDARSNIAVSTGAFADAGSATPSREKGGQKGDGGRRHGLGRAARREQRLDRVEPGGVVSSRG